MVWRLWPQSKIFDEESLNRTSQAYENLIASGDVLPGHDTGRDIAEQLFHEHFHDPAIRAEYEQYLAGIDKNIPDPEPDDLEPEVSQHG